MDAVPRWMGRRSVVGGRTAAALLVVAVALLQGCAPGALREIFDAPEITRLDCPESAMVGDTVRFVVVYDTVDTGPLRVVWQFDDGRSVAGEMEVAYAFEEPGTYTVSVSVVGLGGSDQEACTVRSILPTAARPPIMAPHAPDDDREDEAEAAGEDEAVPEVVTDPEDETVPRNATIPETEAVPAEGPVARASAYTTDTCADSLPVTFEVTRGSPSMHVTWRFGDDAVDEGLRVTHRYARKGVYAVVAIVETEQGRRTLDAGRVRVYPCLPLFRWELPRTFVELTERVAWADGRRPTFEDIDRKIAAALRDAGFDDGRRRYFLYPDGGFVVVTQLECFGDGGARLAGAARWCGSEEDGDWWRRLLTYMEVAAGGSTGSRSRVFAFVVADEIHLAGPMPSPEVVDISAPAAMSEEGGTILPPTNAQTEFSRDHRVRAYVYGFEQNTPYEAADARELDPQRHLREAGIWERLVH